MDTHYSFYEAGRDKLPGFAKIVLRNVRVLSAGKIIRDGCDERHRLGITFDNVAVDYAAGNKTQARFADITLGPGLVGFRPSGPEVRIVGTPGEGSPNACEGKFVPMKQEASGAVAR